MRETKGPIRGDLLKWARTERGLSLRDLARGTGIAISYLSELENGKKTEPRSDRLQSLIQVLGVTSEFVRGQVPRYLENPAACWNLAADCLDRIRSETEEGTWSGLTVSARCRRILSLIITHSSALPKLVVAYVLGVSLDSIEGFMQGTFSIPSPILVKAIADISGLPQDTFLRPGSSSAQPQAERVAQELLPAIQMALRARVTPEELKELIYQAACNNALRQHESPLFSAKVPLQQN